MKNCFWLKGFSVLQIHFYYMFSVQFKLSFVIRNIRGWMEWISLNYTDYYGYRWIDLGWWGNHWDIEGVYLKCLLQRYLENFIGKLSRIYYSTYLWEVFRWVFIFKRFIIGFFLFFFVSNWLVIEGLMLIKGSGRDDGKRKIIHLRVI